MSFLLEGLIFCRFFFSRNYEKFFIKSMFGFSKMRKKFFKNEKNIFQKWGKVFSKMRKIFFTIKEAT